MYILFRSQQYAEELARKANAIVCSSENNLYGINPQDDDIIVVDAHYKGNMSDFSGIEIVYRLQKYECSGKIVKFKILSWFPPESDYLESPKKRLYSQHNVDFVQLPVLNVKLITT